MDLCGYAVLIDGSVFAGLAAVASTLAVVTSRMIGRPLSRPLITRAAIPLGVVLVGLLAGYRWNQLFNKESPPDSPAVLYPVAAILLFSVFIAILASFTATALRQRLRGSTLSFARRALPLSLIVAITASVVLVGRDQVANRLAAAPVSAAQRKATTPRSPQARRPGGPPGSAGWLPYAARRRRPARPPAD